MYNIELIYIFYIYIYTSPMGPYSLARWEISGFLASLKKKNKKICLFTYFAQFPIQLFITYPIYSYHCHLLIFISMVFPQI